MRPVIREADHSSPSNVEVKNVWSYISRLLHALTQGRTQGGLPGCSPPPPPEIPKAEI